jgi:hypothetical protein
MAMTAEEREPFLERDHDGRHPGVTMTTDSTGATAQPAAEPAPTMFTEQQVADAVNHAADDILDVVEAGDEGLRDAMNLMVNATVAYLTGEAQNLQDVVEQDYDADYPTVLSWIEAAV